MSAAAAGQGQTPVTDLLTEVALVCRQEGRPDLERALQLAATRVGRGETIVCFVGEYKQGKSTLINALVGAEVCPVDDDLATSALTVVAYADAPAARVHRTGAEGRKVDDVTIGELALYVSERDNPANEKRVDLVEVGIPSEALSDGLVLVDTPGVGGFGRSYATAVLGFLPVADALVFVSDAGDPLNSDELRFLAEARQACPDVIVARTRADLSVAWRDIVAQDSRHLVGIAPTTLPLAAPLRQRALERRDGAVDQESGYPALLSVIRESFVRRTAAQVRARALSQAVLALDALAQRVADDRAALEHPERVVDAAERAAEAERRGRQLRDAAARWPVTLADAFADLRIEMDRRLRESIARRFEEAEPAIASMDPIAEWDAFIESIRERLASDAFECFRDAHAAAREIALSIARSASDDADPLAREQLEDLAGTADRQAPRRPGSLGPKSGKLDWGLGVVRGAQGGGYTLAWAAGILGLTVAAPIAIGASALFGAKFVLDERKRQTERRRQEARAALKQYVDTLAAEFARRMHHTLNSLQRALRDHFQVRMQDLLAAHANSLRGVRDGIVADEQTRQAQRAQIAVRERRIADVRARVPAARDA